ncbi:UMP kinase [Caldiplasma sukawensis]
MEKFVISLGGSLVIPDLPDLKFLNSFRDFWNKFGNQCLGVVVGGGKTARNYIQSMKQFTDNNFFLDEIGIQATRMNARLVSYVIDVDQTHIPESINDAIDMINSQGKVVMGGTVPGHTTDTVSMLLAESLGIKKVYNLTSVDGVYDSDPKQNKNARFLKTLKYDEAFNLSLSSYTGAGSNQFMDSVSILIAKRSNIKIVIIGGKDFSNIENAINEKDFRGTIIG